MNWYKQSQQENGMKGDNSVAINSFVKRQTPDSPYSHFKGTDDQLLFLIRENFDKAKPGYRDGVVLVPVPSKGFYTSISQLTPETELVATYKSRKEGEEPRKSLHGRGDKMTASSVAIVLYRHDVLGEDGDAETDADWEVISINASPTENDMPMNPETLIANHFHLSGGTVTNMSNDQFVEALRESVMFWKDKVALGQ